MEAYLSGNTINIDFNTPTLINFIPQAFTTVCPKEVEAINEIKDQFKCQVVFASTDSIPVIGAWMETFANIEVPFIGYCHELAHLTGQLDEFHTNRTSILVSPKSLDYEGLEDLSTQYTMQVPLNMQRDHHILLNEVNRSLEAMVSDDYCFLI